MGASYWLYGDEIKRHSGVIDTEKAVEVEVMDGEAKVWKQAKVNIYSKPVKDSEPVTLLGPFSELYDEGKYHIRVLEILPSPLEDE